MGWTDPANHNYATAEIVTASTLNTYVRDNLLDLHRRTTTTANTIQTSETTGSTGYVDLATVGPTVTLTMGTTGWALVFITAGISNNTSNARSLMSFTVSGATTQAASDTYALTLQSYTPGAFGLYTALFPLSLTAGVNTFTAKYSVTAGTATFQSRSMTVLPMGQ